jgi:hypothetical protein
MVGVGVQVAVWVVVAVGVPAGRGDWNIISRAETSPRPNTIARVIPAINNKGHCFILIGKTPYK